MTDRRTRRLSLLAWGLCLVTLAVVAITSGLVVLNLQTIRDPNEANLIEIVLSISFAVLGALVASRQPSNALGWVFLALALLNALPGVAGQYTRYTLLTQPAAPFTAWIPWIGDLAGILVYPAGLAAVAFLLAPNSAIAAATASTMEGAMCRARLTG